LAATGFGCRVIYYSTSGKNTSTDYPQVDFDTLLAESDVISIHCPLTKATENLMNQDAFSKMKSSAILINVARGPIVNEMDLSHAIRNSMIAGAGLDVLSQEPMKEYNPLWSLKDDPRLFITPHIGWAATESRNRLIDAVCNNINRFLES
jgi:glycerate dehydrogenase